LAILERLIHTEDGSYSLFSDQFNQQYHSLQGAITESLHIFIELGLRPILENAGSPISVIEMGFGTGLNAFLAWQLADQLKKPINYTSIEAFPISLEEASMLNYESLTGKEGFLQLHASSWGTKYSLSEYFTFGKEQARFEEYDLEGKYDVIFYDAFDPKAQPELWTEQIFSKIAAHSDPGTVLVTYSSKGIVKRALAAAGFEVKRYPGPGKKTHVLKAVKKETT
jgi:tRNA U34 5-methylaminomethyl-2-thiouridine-forming methyltransferase MnmC